MDVVTKATATVTPVEDSKSKHGEFDVILSTSALDRDGDELHADEWKQPLPDKISFDSDHGMSVASCVGSGKPFINDAGQLQVRGTFASTPHGQAVRTLVNEGHIDSVSVAFMNHKTQKSGKPLRELLNGAFVAVPANPQARVLSSKAVKDGSKITVTVEGGGGSGTSGIITPKEAAANYRLDQNAAIADMFQNEPLDGDGSDNPQRKAYWQGVHDLAIKLGAGCPYSDPQAIPDVLNAPGNRSVQSEVTTKAADEPCDCECAGCTCPSSKSLSQKSTEESTAADQKSTAAEESAEDVALLGKSLANRLGVIDF